jgi:hypothetical protein
MFHKLRNNMSHAMRLSSNFYKHVTIWRLQNFISRAVSQTLFMPVFLLQVSILLDVCFNISELSMLTFIDLRIGAVSEYTKEGGQCGLGNRRMFWYWSHSAHVGVILLGFFIVSFFLKEKCWYDCIEYLYYN